MIIVSGCPRSGTSLMMLLHKEALGEDKIIGSKWMGLDPKFKDGYIQRCKEYVFDKKNPSWRQERDRTKEMNPNGFWECPWTTNGIQWTQNTPKKDKVCKIVSGALAKSNPYYVDKLLLMVRHPWAVANSQKDLKVNLPFSNARNKDLSNISPTMYIKSTIAISNWIIENNPEFLLVDYDQLVMSPDQTINKIKDFIGEGDWSKAKKHINKKLKRNVPKRVDNNKNWDIALEIHDHFKLGRFEEVLNIEKKLEKRKTHENITFMCPRWGGMVNKDMCQKCRGGDTEFIYNFKKTSEKRNIDWRNEPCLWECGMNPDRESYTPLTIEQSIQNNHWFYNSKASSSLSSEKKTNKDESLDFNIFSNNLAKKECEFCEDFDLNEYLLSIEGIKINNDCMKLDFDIEGYKSTTFELNKSINGQHILGQNQYPCLWSKRIDNAIKKYSSKGQYCKEEFLDLIDVNVYLEKIDTRRWWLSIVADGGFDLFSSIIAVKEGKCVGTVEFKNIYKEQDFKKSASEFLEKEGIKDSIGTIVGYGGRCVFECEKDN